MRTSYTSAAPCTAAAGTSTAPLASPFRPGPDGTRQEVVDKYRIHLLSRPDLLALLPALRGRRLGCWCAPERCHAEVIAELADEAR